MFVGNVILAHIDEVTFVVQAMFEHLLFSLAGNHNPNTHLYITPVVLCLLCARSPAVS